MKRYFILSLTPNPQTTHPIVPIDLKDKKIPASSVFFFTREKKK